MPFGEFELPVQVQAMTHVAGFLLAGLVDQRRDIRSEERPLLQAPVLQIVQLPDGVAAPQPGLLAEFPASVHPEAHRLGETVARPPAAAARHAGGKVRESTAGASLVHVVRVGGQCQLDGGGKAVQGERTVVPRFAAYGRGQTGPTAAVTPDVAPGAAEIPGPCLFPELQVDRALLLAVGNARELGHVRLLVVHGDLLDGVRGKILQCDRGIVAEELLAVHEDLRDLLALCRDRPVGIDVDAGKPPQQLLDRRVGRRRKRLHVVAEGVALIHEGDVFHADHHRVYLQRSDGQHHSAGVHAGVRDIEVTAQGPVADQRDLEDVAPRRQAIDGEAAVLRREGVVGQHRVRSGKHDHHGVVQRRARRVGDDPAHPMLPGCLRAGRSGLREPGDHEHGKSPTSDGASVVGSPLVPLHLPVHPNLFRVPSTGVGPCSESRRRPEFRSGSTGQP